MQKIQFEDYPGTTTPVSADNLNQVQTNVEDAINGVINEIPEVLNEEGLGSNKCYSVDYLNNIINDAQYCVATISSAQTISSNYVVNLNTNERSNGNFTISGGGIIIGAGINLIRVSASIFVDAWAGSNNYLWGKILKNNTAVASSITGSPATYLSSSIPVMIIPVEEGDVIKLMADAGSGGSLRSGSANTFLCVEKIN